jgi:hypothetical protein
LRLPALARERRTRTRLQSRQKDPEWCCLQPVVRGVGIGKSIAQNGAHDAQNAA